MGQDTPLHVYYNTVFRNSTVPENTESLRFVSLEDAVGRDVLSKTENFVDEFYRMFGTAEVYEKNVSTHGVKAGYILFLKIASIRHAVRTSDMPVLWMDADITIKKAFDARFYSFVRPYDACFIPFLYAFSRKSKASWQSLHDYRWRVESGFMYFANGEESKSIVDAIYDLYAGGRLKTLRLNQKTLPMWIQQNTMLNDVYTWAIVLHAAYLGSPVPNVLKVRQTDKLCWFSARTTGLMRNATSYTSEFSLDEYAYHAMTTGPYSQAARSKIFTDKRISIRRSAAVTSTMQASVSKH